jgi:hypothetical protein
MHSCPAATVADKTTIKMTIQCHAANDLIKGMEMSHTTVNVMNNNHTNRRHDSLESRVAIGN